MTAIPNVVGPGYNQYNAVVKVNETIAGFSFWATGTLISPDEVLIANHEAEWKGSVNGVATNITVEPGYNNGESAFGSITGSVAHYFDLVNQPGQPYENIQSDFAIIHLSRPVVGASVMRVSTGFDGGLIHVSGYPGIAGGARVDTFVSVYTDPNYSVFQGPPVTGGSSGSPLWNLGADGIANVYGVMATSTGTQSQAVKFTAAQKAQIAAWVAADDYVPPPPPLPKPPVPTRPPSVLIHDQTTGLNVVDTISRDYHGPVSYLKTEFIDLSPHNLNIMAGVPDIFIHTGGGNDAVHLLSGRNVVDGGAGSNFLTGGTGIDTFFVDARALTKDVWSTVRNFHSGDAATLFGISDGEALRWMNSDGAVGNQGLTLHATTDGKTTASLTLAGYNKGDLESGKITVSFGHNASGDYLYVHAI